MKTPVRTKSIRDVMKLWQDRDKGDQEVAREPVKHVVAAEHEAAGRVGECGKVA